jgi:hypothetical protein
MNRKGQKAFCSDLQDDIDDLIDVICEKAERERERVNISDASDLWELSDILQQHLKWVDRAEKCKSVKAVEILRKKMEFALA